MEWFINWRIKRLEEKRLRLLIKTKSLENIISSASAHERIPYFIFSDLISAREQLAVYELRLKRQRGIKECQ